jgi:hypothetical protein
MDNEFLFVANLSMERRLAGDQFTRPTRALGLLKLKDFVAPVKACYS